jgi:hypothetical protein
VDAPKWSPDASWASILPGLAPTARDGFGLGFGPPFLGFMFGHLIHVVARIVWYVGLYGFDIYLGPFMCISIYALLQMNIHQNL